jgi:hypothetical protein
MGKQAVGIISFVIGLVVGAIGALTIAGVAAGALAVGLIAALSGNYKNNDNRNNSANYNGEYQRGYNDGMYSANYSNSDSEGYHSGFMAGEAERNNRRYANTPIARSLPAAAGNACISKGEYEWGVYPGSVSVVSSDSHSGNYDVTLATGHWRAICRVTPYGEVLNSNPCDGAQRVTSGLCLRVATHMGAIRTVALFFWHPYRYCG